MEPNIVYLPSANVGSLTKTKKIYKVGDWK